MTTNSKQFNTYNANEMAENQVSGKNHCLVTWQLQLNALSLKYLRSITIIPINSHGRATQIASGA